MESKEHWNYRVLIVDDENGIHSDFKDMLNPNRRGALTDELAETLLGEVSEKKTSFLPNFELLHAKSGEEAYDIIRAGKSSDRPIAVAYIDVRMPPGIDGVEAIRRIRQIEKDIELVIMTAYTDKPLPEIVRDMELLNKLLYIRKPFAPEEVQQITLSLAEKWNVERELAKKQQQTIANHQNLEISHQRLRTVLDSAKDAIGMFDGEERLLFANQYYQQLFDLTEDQLRQMSPDELEARIKARVKNRNCRGRHHSLKILKTWWKRLETRASPNRGCSIARSRRCGITVAPPPVTSSATTICPKKLRSSR